MFDMKVKRFIAGLVMSVMVAASAGAAEYAIDPVHSHVGFKIRHLMSKVSGRFDDFGGIIRFNPDKKADLAANVTIRTGSVNTSNDKRDHHLKSPDFFNVETYPVMTFKSTKARKAEKNKIRLVGDLTLLGVTKPVVLQVEFLGEGVDPHGKTRVGFSATGTLNRKEWGMVYNITDKGGVLIGDDVELHIDVEGVKKQ